MFYLKLKNSILGLLESETQSAILVITLISVFCLGNIFFGFNWIFYILSMLIGFLISLKNPRSGLYTIIFLTIVFERFFALESIPLTGMEIKLYPIDIIFGASFLGMLFHYAFSSEKIKISFPEKMLGAFMFLNIIYFLFSFFQNVETNLAFSTLKNYIFYSLFYFLIYGLIKNKKDLWRLFQFFFAGAITIIIFFIISLIRQKGIWTEITPLSTDGVRLLGFSHGLFMSIALIPMFFYITFSEQKNKLWLNLILIVWIGGVIGTLMRHLWIALFISFAIIFIALAWENKKIVFKSSLKTLAPLLFLIAIIFSYTTITSKHQNQISTSNTPGIKMIIERTQSINDGDGDSSFYWRGVAWRSGIQRFQENPIFGIGTGQRVVVEMKWLTQNVEIRSIHNSYLSILIQFGLLGLTIFLVFIGITLLKLYAFRDNFSAVAVASVLIFFLVAAAFQPYLETNVLALFFWIALGLAKALPEMKN